MSGSLANLILGLATRASGAAGRIAAAVAPTAAVAGAAAAAADAGALIGERGSFIVNDQNVQFPSDLKTAYISMRFEKYVRRSINEQPFFQPQETIRLALPGELTDNISVNYQTESLGSMVGAGVEAISSTPGNISNLFSSGFSRESIERLGSSIQGAAGGIGVTALQSIPRAIGNPGGSGLSSILANQASNALSGLSALTGITPNPYQTVLFKSPNFKKHKFSWTLVPKNEQESRDIQFIISLFKYHMLPGISGANALFFSYPEILQIKLFPRDDYLYKFKPCVVETVSVNYAPNGLSFYRVSGAPVAINFSIMLQEIEIWTKADYVRDASGRPTRATAPNLRIQ